MADLDGLLRSVLVSDLDVEVLARGELVKTQDGDLVLTRDLVVVGSVLEPKREKTLLLAVGLVNSGKGSSDNGGSTQESRLEGGVLSGRTFTVVVVTDDNPRDAVVSVPSTDSGDGTELASLLVEYRVGLTGVGVDGTDQAVLRNVLEMTSVLEPRTTGGDVVSCALAEGLDENGGLNNVLAVPWLERLEELESVRGGVDSDLDGSSVSGRSLEGVLSGVIPSGRKLKA